MKQKWKRFMAVLLAAIMVLTICPLTGSKTAYAASVKYDRLYINGSYTIGNHTKSGCWFQWDLNGKTGFCMTLGG